MDFRRIAMQVAEQTLRINHQKNARDKQCEIQIGGTSIYNGPKQHNGRQYAELEQVGFPIFYEISFQKLFYILDIHNC
jgi:hypothetical protein